MQKKHKTCFLLKNLKLLLFFFGEQGHTEDFVHNMDYEWKYKNVYFQLSYTVSLEKLTSDEDIGFCIFLTENNISLIHTIFKCPYLRFLCNFCGGKSFYGKGKCAFIASGTVDNFMTVLMILTTLATFR